MDTTSPRGNRHGEMGRGVGKAGEEGEAEPAEATKRVLRATAMRLGERDGTGGATRGDQDDYDKG